MVVVFTLFVIHVQAKNETKPVYFSLIVSQGEHGFNSSGAIPAIDIALEQIEDQQNLRNYNLTYATEQNSKVGRLLHFVNIMFRWLNHFGVLRGFSLHLLLQCARTDSLEVFFKDIRNKPQPKIAVVGCGCSVATEAVAAISHYWNISQVHILNCGFK